MSKHTPGPWESDFHEGEYLISGVTDGHRHFVAVGRREANARLITAAPEMRSALSEVFSMIEDVRTGKIERGVNLYLADAQAVILDAIAKAEGKS